MVPGVKPVLNQQITTGSNAGYIQYVNPAAFAFPATSVQPIAGVTAPGAALPILSPFGNAARNPLRNTAFYETDFALNKRFSTPVESLKLEFRSEFYNVFNHTNLYLPNTLSGTAGAAATTGGGIITSTFQPRVIQFALKVLY